MPVGERHVVVARGRDYADVSPLRGIYTGSATSDTNVDVDHAIEWYQGMWVEAVTSWRTPEELLDLRAVLKGHKKIQGSGTWYRRKAAGEEEGRPPRVAAFLDGQIERGPDLFQLAAQITTRTWAEVVLDPKVP